MGIVNSKKIIEYKDLFKGDFWRYFGRAVWLFFPAIFFMFLVYMCFWKLSQGRDVMIITLENRKVFGFFLLALVFWVMITWYTSRLVAKAKELVAPDNHLMWLTLRVQGPRILAFTCITIVILGFFQLPYSETPKLSNLTCIILFWLSLPWYFTVYQIVHRALQLDRSTGIRGSIRVWQRIRLSTYILLSAATLIVVLYKWIWGLIILLLAYQVGFIIIILIRRNIIDIKNEYASKTSEEYIEKFKAASARRKIRMLVTDKEDRRYFQSLNVVSFFAVAVYFATIFSVHFSVWIGSFPFLFLAFGVLLGLGNAIALISVVMRFNFHLLFVTLAFIVGHVSEPHYTRLLSKKEGSARFENRQGVKEYFDQWLADPDRLKALQDSGSVYPIYFVLANGGASRSGYWAASVLSRMEDETNGQFSKHLFCMSGASGGSVGNATFFSVLRAKSRLLQLNKSATPCLDASKEYLRSDFLTFTLARLLGPDIFRNFITLYRVNDRASALSFAMEKAAGSKAFLNDSLGVPFSDIITQKNIAYRLPILFVNTTRMQDGRPGLISNIRPDDSIFNKRIDVLSLLDEKKDMTLSTGVVLGASFPYLSPAGRIDNKTCDTCKTIPNYFVDGGYFDNSGSGAVYELILALKQLLETEPYKMFQNKFSFNILHITNDPQTETALKTVNPFTNDLAAPVKTLLGAYETQTSVNDYRLEKYMSSYGNDSVSRYLHLSLYRPKDTMSYTMSWVISKYVLNAMDKRLFDNPELEKLIAEMKMVLK